MGNESSGRPSPPAASEAEQIVREVEALRERILYFAARRLRSFADAEDAAQETVRRAIEALQAGRIEKPASLPSFLFQTALHVCQRRYRSAGREVKALRRFGASTPESAPDDPLGALLSAERRSAVRGALERLDEEDREVLTLTYAEALPTSDIARKLRTTEGNVRVRRHRALGRMAKLLGVTRASGREP